MNRQRSACVDSVKINVLTVFRSIVEANSRRMSQFCELLDETVPPLVLSADARDLRDGPVGQARPLKNQSVTLTITSPPYAGAQKYVRATSSEPGLGSTFGHRKSFENARISVSAENTIPRPLMAGRSQLDLRLLTVSYSECGRQVHSAPTYSHSTSTR